MNNIHPNLKKEAFLVRFGLPLFLLSSVLPLIIVFIILQATLEFNFIRTISLFIGILIISVISAVIYFKLSGKYKQKVQRASDLLFHGKPQHGVIEPESIMSVWGPIFKIRNNESNAIDFVTFKVEKHGTKKMYSQLVELYKHERQIHDTVVLKVGNTYKIGKLQNNKKADDIARGFRKMKTFMLAGVPLSILVLVIAQLFHINSIKSNAEFASETNNWPITSGRITLSSVNEIRMKQGKTNVKGYTATIRYLYNLNSKEYQSTNIHLGYEPTKKYDDALKYVSKYPLGSTVSVHYNPKDYSFALLEAGHEEDILAEIGEVYVVSGAIAGILILTSIILIFVFRGQEKKAKEFMRV